jgi:5'-3' exoribonuclease 1
MAKLSEQLRWFVNKKITEDAHWRDVKVVLSGHDVPGEGEHKIMEYIRLSKAQPNYDPNTRHCMYGLDADLIMLGLLSHDPHFCLLREEVKFGPRRSSKRGCVRTLSPSQYPDRLTKATYSGIESQNYYLLHLTLMREYLDLEFRDIEPVLPFEYSLERVIDDFILLAVFVGNDFLPNLPDLHIHENGLERLFDVYKKVLPSLGAPWSPLLMPRELMSGADGYINESGAINAKRLQVILDEMKIWEQEVFEKEYVDMNWYKGKQSKHVKAVEAAHKSKALSMHIVFQKLSSH